MIISIVSGYFNPFHLGHLRMIQSAKTFCDKLIVIVNNDKQQILKKGKIIMDEKERVEILKAFRDVDEVILAVDDYQIESGERPVIKTLELIAKKYSKDKLIFCNGGDRKDLNTIPEGDACMRNNIEIRFNVGEDFKSNPDKIISSGKINKLCGKE